MMTTKENGMRLALSLFCALMLGLATPAEALTAKKKSKAKPAAQEEMTLAELLGKDLAAAVEGANQAYDDAEAALSRHGKRKRASNNTVLRELAEARASYAKALQRARDARTDDDNALLRDQVLVSITQSLRAIDLITQGLRDDDDDQVDAGVQLAGLAQADLDSLAEGGGAAGIESAGGAPALGPSIGMNFGMSSQDSSFNMAMDVNLSVPVNEAMDIGLGGSLNGTTSETATTSSGNLTLGGNLFSRYHFLGAFAGKPNLVPYVGAKLGMNMGSQWSGTGLNFNSSDSLGTELSAQLGMLVFIDAKSAITFELESGSSSSSSEDTAGKVSSSSSSSVGLSLGLRRMF